MFLLVQHYEQNVPNVSVSYYEQNVPNASVSSIL